MKNKPKKDKKKDKDKKPPHNGAAPFPVQQPGEPDAGPDNSAEEREKLMALPEEEFNPKFDKMLVCFIFVFYSTF